MCNGNTVPVLIQKRVKKNFHPSVIWNAWSAHRGVQHASILPLVPSGGSHYAVLQTAARQYGVWQFTMSVGPEHWADSDIAIPETLLADRQKRLSYQVTKIHFNIILQSTSMFLLRFSNINFIHITSYVRVSVHHNSILYKEPTRCNFGSIVY